MRSISANMALIEWIGKNDIGSWRGAKFTPQRMQKLKKITSLDWKSQNWIPLQTGHSMCKFSMEFIRYAYCTRLDIVAVKADYPLRSPNSELVSVYKVWECTMFKKCIYVYIITIIFKYWLIMITTYPNFSFINPVQISPNRPTVFVAASITRLETYSSESDLSAWVFSSIQYTVTIHRNP